MGKRIVIALGGNALGKNLPEQMLAVKETSKAIADLVEAGHTVVVAHGNGPQVGMIQNAFATYCRQEPSADVMPLSMCVAMSQGYIGYDLQNALKEELLNRGLQQGVATVLTQVVTIPPSSTPPSPSAPLCPRKKPRTWPVKRAGTWRRTRAGAGGRWWPPPSLWPWWS